MLGKLAGGVFKCPMPNCKPKSSKQHSQLSLSFYSHIFAALVGSVGVASSELHGHPGNTMAAVNSEVGLAANQFAIDMYQKVAGDTSETNVFYSPFSINLALTMTYHGTAGATMSQLKDVLKLEDLDKKGIKIQAEYAKMVKLLNEKQEGCTLHLANRLFAQESYKLLDSYTGLLKDIYAGELGLVDYINKPSEAVSTINTWVENQTQKKIQNLVPIDAINALTRLVLVNAIYFKGTWQKQFDPKQTNPAPFYHRGDWSDSIMSSMMERKGTMFLGEDTSLDCQVLELPYMGRRISMFIVLPNDVAGLPALEKKLSAKLLHDLLAKVKEQKKVFAMIPKFKLEQTLDLQKTLEALGVRDLFDEHKCDLSGITGTRDLVVSKVIHKAFVDVNEEGSEAAAATAVVAMFRSAVMEEPNPEFIANHPFLFVIRDNASGSVLFLGRLAKPQEVPDVGQDEL